MTSAAALLVPVAPRRPRPPPRPSLPNRMRSPPNHPLCLMGTACLEINPIPISPPPRSPWQRMVSNNQYRSELGHGNRRRILWPESTPSSIWESIHTKSIDSGSLLPDSGMLRGVFCGRGSMFQMNCETSFPGALHPDIRRIVTKCIITLLDEKWVHGLFPSKVPKGTTAEKAVWLHFELLRSFQIYIR